VSGIPCSHACAAIYMHKQRSDEWLDNCYKMKKYMQGYAGRVYGIEGPIHGQLTIHVKQFYRLTFEGFLVDRR
jgi:hypothetical protein